MWVSEGKLHTKIAEFSSSFVETISDFRADVRNESEMYKP